MKNQKKPSPPEQMLVRNNWTDSSERMTIITPLTMFYKIRDEKNDKLLHAAFYPGSMSSAYMPNNAVSHQHDHFELMYVLEGELTNKIERISYTYKKGDACLLNRNTRHMDIPGPRCSVVFINFHAEYILDLMDRDVLFDLSPRLTSPTALSMTSCFPISREKNALPAIIWNFPLPFTPFPALRKIRLKSLLTGCNRA